WARSRLAMRPTARPPEPPSPTNRVGVTSPGMILIGMALLAPAVSQLASEHQVGVVTAQHQAAADRELADRDRSPARRFFEGLDALGLDDQRRVVLIAGLDAGVVGQLAEAWQRRFGPAEVHGRG